MATLAKLLVEVGVKIDGALKVEQKVKKLRVETQKFGQTADKSVGVARAAFAKLARSASKGLNKLQAVLQKNLFTLKGFATNAKRAGVVVAAAATGIFLFVKSQTAALDETNKLSESLGTGVEELQRLQFAASQSGVDANQLSVGLKKLNANLLDISKGGGKLADEALMELGLNISDLNGLSQTNRIGLIADRLNEVSDAGRRASLAGRLFGMRAGPQLATLLSEGSKGIAALTEQASNVLTQEQINEATRFQDLLGEVQAEITLVAREVAVALIPAVTDVIEGFKDWISENDDFIRQDLPIIVDGITTAVEFLVDTVDRAVTVFRLFTDVIEFQTDLLERTGIPGIDGLSQAFSSLAFGPIVDAIAAIETATDLLREFGIISSKIEGGTGRAFAKVGRGVSAQARRLRQAQPAAGASALPFFLRRPAEGRGGARRPKRGGGGAAARKARAPRERQPTGAERQAALPGVTVDEAIQGLLAGRGDVLTERLKGLAAVTPSTRDVKPTVAIDFFNFNVVQNITAPSPLEAGRESAQAIRAEFRRGIAQAGQALAGNTVR